MMKLWMLSAYSIREVTYFGRCKPFVKNRQYRGTWTWIRNVTEEHSYVGVQILLHQNLSYLGYFYIPKICNIYSWVFSGNYYEVIFKPSCFFCDMFIQLAGRNHAGKHLFSCNDKIVLKAQKFVMVPETGRRVPPPLCKWDLTQKELLDPICGCLVLSPPPCAISSTYLMSQGGDLTQEETSFSSLDFHKGDSLSQLPLDPQEHQWQEKGGSETIQFGAGQTILVAASCCGAIPVDCDLSQLNGNR